MPVFKTVRETAALGILNEHRLRVLVSEGKCPGIRSGNRFLINVPALMEKLENDSKISCEKEVK